MPKFRPVIFIIIIIVIILCLSSFDECESLRFELQSGSTKCISEDIKKDGMTVGKYNVINPNPKPNPNPNPNPNNNDARPLPRSHRVTARVTSPRGNNYHYGDRVESGTFAFTAAETGDYMACFWAPYHNPPIKITVEFDWRTGVDAKDWYKVVRKGQIDLLDVELRRLHETVKSVHDEMFYLREREEEMQALNRATNAKMAVFSFLSIILCLSVAALQLWHLKGYFERKKLL